MNPTTTAPVAADTCGACGHRAGAHRSAWGDRIAGCGVMSDGVVCPCALTERRLRAAARP